MGVKPYHEPEATMLQILFFYVVIEIPGDVVKFGHRLVTGDRFRPAGKWVYRFLGAMLFCTVVFGLAALGDTA